jgi:predicted outer membrane repeat protein
MTVTARVISWGDTTQGNSHILGAFINDEVRGVAEPMDSGDFGWLYFLTIYSNTNGDDIEFRFYDGNLEETFPTYNDSMTFVSNAIHGSPDAPYDIDAGFLKINIDDENVVSYNVADSTWLDAQNVKFIAQDWGTGYNYPGYTIVKYEIASTPVNDAPFAFDAQTATDEETPVSLDLNPFVIDFDSDTFTWSVVGGDLSDVTVNIVDDTVGVFTPAQDVTGTYDIQLQVSDGAGGTATMTVTITVDAVNDAPILDPSGNPELNSIDEDEFENSGTSIFDIIEGVFPLDMITDVDANSHEGMAIIEVEGAANGEWQFTINGGDIWHDVGNVSETSARLLKKATDTKIKFVPDPNFNGNVQFTFRAWDQTSGVNGSLADVTQNGGTTAFSTDTEIVTLEIVSINDAPTLSPINPQLPIITEDEVNNPGISIANIVGTSISDIDGNEEGIAIYDAEKSRGMWQYCLSGDSIWTTMSSVSDTNAFLLRSIDSLRFVPDEANADSAQFSYYAWDQSTDTTATTADVSIRGGITPYSLISDTAFIIVTGKNDNPSDIALSNNLIRENKPIGSIVGTLSTTDIDWGDSVHTYFLASGDGDAHNAYFSLANDTLKTNVVLDYEKNSVCNIRIQSVDDSGGVFQKEFNIDLIDLERIYVKKNAAGAKDGSSWEDAYPELYNATEISTTGEDIWVATGTYTPDDGDDRTASFELSSNAGIYGGFDGTEDSLSQRDWRNHTTTLSGDIGTPTDSTDNSFHVVTANGLTDTAALDGVTISRGNANGAIEAQQNGGGVYTVNSPVIIANCTFVQNHASDGGAIYSHAGSPEIVNCRFHANSATSGGGIFNSNTENALIANSVFSGNQADQGGAIYNRETNGTQISTSTFSHNSGVGQSIFNANIVSVAVNNSIFHGKPETGNHIENAKGNEAEVTYSVVQGGYTGTANLDIDPLFADADGGDNLFGTIDDDLHLSPCSPAIDAGDTLSLPSDYGDLDGDGDTMEILPMDLDGNLRIYDGNGDGSLMLDMGAYEAQQNMYISDIETAPVHGDTLDFGDILIDESAYQTFQIVNSGCNDLSVDSIKVVGSDFSLHNPPNFPISIAPNDTSVITVTFHPTIVGNQTGSVSIYTNDPDESEIMINLTGEGVGLPELLIEPDTLNFGNVVLTEWDTLSLRLTNTGYAELQIDSLTIDAPIFQVISPAAMTLLPAEHDSVWIRFRPAVIGENSALGSVHSNAPTSPTTFGLLGNGINAGMFDVNQDGVVDIFDVQMVAAKQKIDSTHPDYELVLDFNTDGVIDEVDLQWIIAAWKE